jgi:hypothetical protein
MNQRVNAIANHVPAANNTPSSARDTTHDFAMYRDTRITTPACE